MLKDTNPDHYKVDGANFIKYMNDPKISGFGNWMFANGFNSGVWASSNWISVKDRLPEKNGRYLCRYEQEVYGEVCRCTDFGIYDSDIGENGGWFVGKVTHWMPLPEPPKENVNGNMDF